MNYILIIHTNFYKLVNFFCKDPFGIWCVISAVAGHYWLDFHLTEWIVRELVYFSQLFK